MSEQNPNLGTNSGSTDVPKVDLDDIKTGNDLTDSDLTDRDLSSGDFDGGELATSDDDAVGTSSQRTSKKTGGFGSRLVGFLAIILGLIGSLVAIAAALLCGRLMLGAADAAETLVQPIAETVDRLDTRIDQTDDLIDADGIPKENLAQLGARVDGLVDLTNSANQSFEAIEDHPIYQWFPTELDDLNVALGSFKQSASDIDSEMLSAAANDVDSARASRMAQSLNSMQSKIKDVRDLTESAADSLQRWIRLGSLAGLFGSLWGLWGQISLFKRGWQGLRGRL